MIGVILGAGSGSRMRPVTSYITKHLLPVHDKPMIYYSLSVLLLAGVRHLKIVVSPRDLDSYKSLLGHGEKFGVQIEYVLQDMPAGIAAALKLALIDERPRKVLLILGDNFFFGNNISTIIDPADFSDGCRIFTKQVSNPKDYGVVTRCEDVVKVVEKPAEYLGNQVATGFYMFDDSVIDACAELRISSRGEFEVADILNYYGRLGRIDVVDLGRGMAWFDMGTYSRMNEVQNLIKSFEERQGFKIGCLEEIALNRGWISKESIRASINSKKNLSSYEQYLVSLL